MQSNIPQELLDRVRIALEKQLLKEATVEYNCETLGFGCIRLVVSITLNDGDGSYLSTADPKMLDAALAYVETYIK